MEEATKLAISEGLEGNQNALKFDTVEKRQEVMAKYLEHCKKGLSDDCFLPCDPKTFNSYCERFPSEFRPDLVSTARRERRYFWENMGVDGSQGMINGFNGRSWQFNMQNRYKWSDRRDYNMTSKVEMTKEDRKKILSGVLNEEKHSQEGAGQAQGDQEAPSQAPSVQA